MPLKNLVLSAACGRTTPDTTQPRVPVRKETPAKPPPESLMRPPPQRKDEVPAVEKKEETDVALPTGDDASDLLDHFFDGGRKKPALPQPGGGDGSGEVFTLEKLEALQRKDGNIDLDEALSHEAGTAAQEEFVDQPAPAYPQPPPPPREEETIQQPAYSQPPQPPEEVAQPPTYTQHEEELAASGDVHLQTGLHRIPFGGDTAEKAINKTLKLGGGGPAAPQQQPGAPGVVFEEPPADAPGSAAQPQQQGYPAPPPEAKETILQEPTATPRVYRPRVPIPPRRTEYPQQQPHYPPVPQQEQPTIPPRTTEYARKPTGFAPAPVDTPQPRQEQPSARHEVVSSTQHDTGLGIVPGAKVYSLDVAKYASVDLGNGYSLHTACDGEDKKHRLRFRLHTPYSEQDGKTYPFYVSQAKRSKTFDFDWMPVIIDVVKCGTTKVDVTVSQREGTVKTYKLPGRKGLKNHVLELSAGLIALVYMAGVHTVPEVRQTIDASVLPQFLKNYLFDAIVPLIMLAGTISMYVSSKISRHEPPQTEVKR